MKINKNSILLVVALIMINANTLINPFATIPNFLNGFLKGSALIILMFCAVKAFKTSKE